MGFAATMLSSFPSTMTVPQPLAMYFKWVEDQGLVREFEDGSCVSYANVDPSLNDDCIFIAPPDIEYVKAWTHTDDPSVNNRLAAFCRTGGDGSYAALWTDDNGDTQIVHMGSGSGSTMLGIFTENAIDFLRLLAIGYTELCWYEQYAQTPMQVWEEEWGEEYREQLDEGNKEPDVPKPPKPPKCIRDWLAAEFGVTAPETASEIVSNVTDMDDMDSDDPFLRWIMSQEVE